MTRYYTMCILATWHANVFIYSGVLCTQHFLSLDPVPTHKNFPLKCATLILSLFPSLHRKAGKGERQKPPSLALALQECPSLYFFISHVPQCPSSQIPGLHMLIKLTLHSLQILTPPHPFGNLQASSSHTCPPLTPSSTHTERAQPPSHTTPTPCVCAGTHKPSVFSTLYFSSSDTLHRRRFLISYTYVPTSSHLLLCTQMPITQASHPSRASRAGGSWSELHLFPSSPTPNPSLTET